MALSMLEAVLVLRLCPCKVGKMHNHDLRYVICMRTVEKGFLSPFIRVRKLGR